jgi:hypothetical protein
VHKIELFLFAFFFFIYIYIYIYILSSWLLTVVQKLSFYFPDVFLRTKQRFSDNGLEAQLTAFFLFGTIRVLN